MDCFSTNRSDLSRVHEHGTPRKMTGNPKGIKKVLFGKLSADLLWAFNTISVVVIYGGSTVDLKVKGSGLIPGGGMYIPTT